MAQRRELILGDGNFSFSLAYVKKNKEFIELTATSYDSLEEVLEKYPESANILKKLNEYGVIVMHGIDATNLHDCEKIHKKFDKVIFNHPHCGQENVRRHQIFLSHFFYSAKHVIDIEKGEIHVALALGQPERWQVTSRAQAQNLVLLEQFEFDDSLYPGYERKRHQNGKSFQLVLLHGKKLQQKSLIFVFVTKQNQKQIQLFHKESKRQKLDNSLSKENVGQNDIHSADHGTSIDMYSCLECKAIFKSLQGLNTHINMVHKLKRDCEKHFCGECQRDFIGRDSFYQHNKSKHGKDSDIKPKWILENELTGGNQYHCPICNFYFVSNLALSRHINELAPDESISKTCEFCGKLFLDLRALRQHKNFCSSFESN